MFSSFSALERISIRLAETVSITVTDRGRRRNKNLSLLPECSHGSQIGDKVVAEHLLFFSLSYISLHRSIFFFSITNTDKNYTHLCRPLSNAANNANERNYFFLLRFHSIGKSATNVTC